MTRRIQEQNLRRSFQEQDIAETCQMWHSKVYVQKEITLDKSCSGVFSLQFNYDGTKLAAGFNNGGVRVYDASTGKFFRELRANRHGGYQVMCLRFHPLKPDILYAVTSEGHVYLFNVETGNSQNIIIERGNEINYMDFDIDGLTFATCGKDLAVRIYDAKINKEIRQYLGHQRNLQMPVQENQDLEAGNTQRVFSLRFSPDNENIFLTAGWDNHIKIWDRRTTDGIKREIYGPHVCGDAMDISQDKQILTGSWRGIDALQIWDYAEGKLVRNIDFPIVQTKGLKPVGPFLYCAQYACKGCVVAGGSGTNSVEVIDVEENTLKMKSGRKDKHVGSIPMIKQVQAVDTADDGRLIAVGGGDNVIKLCSIK